MPLEPESIGTLADLLHQDPPPKELEITILPFPDDNDTSSFMKDGIHLGIHAPHVPKLAREFRKFYYGSRSAAISNGEHNDTDRNKLMDCVSCLLLLCPDHATAWADRRRLLLQREELSITSSLSSWETEIGFLNMLFTQHSKAPNAWGHRRWVCRQILKTLKDNYIQESSDRLIKWATYEIAVCTVIAEKYPKNYYAWTHRSFIIRELVDMMQRDNGLHDDDIRAMLQAEVETIEPWLLRHVSDHSAAHYGGEVLLLWLKVGKDESSMDDVDWKIETMQEKLQTSRDLIDKFPSHEVIWIWRRICSRLLLDCYPYRPNDNDDSSITLESMVSFLQKEILYTSSMIETCFSSSNDKDDINHQNFSSAYALWILSYAKRIINLDTSLIMEDISTIKASLGENNAAIANEAFIK